VARNLVVVVWMESPHFIISCEVLDKNAMMSMWQFHLCYIATINKQ